MISICNILPNNLINKDMPRQEYELYLANQILKEPSKFEFLKKDKEKQINSYKILDNSACELGHALPIDDVLKAAEIIGADEIVLPDAPRSGSSLTTTIQCLKEIPEDTPYNLAAVAQGGTTEEVHECIEQILAMKRIHTIMLPKWYCDQDSTNGLGRYNLTRFILVAMDKLGVQKDVHWLGMGVGMRELMTPISWFVRSIDTGYFAALATSKWSALDVTAERPRELKIDLTSMDVDMERWKKFVCQQKQLLGEIDQ